jgi:hypothetical protein
MASRLKNIKFGFCNIQDFANFINERHNIYINRFIKKLNKPWTDDKILQSYKFTNVFRQLDKGTIALQEMLKNNKFNYKNEPQEFYKHKESALIFFNICWYRYFNWYEHGNNLKFVCSYKEVENYILRRYKEGKRIFTGAWMTTGVFAEDKHITYLRACKEAWNKRFEFVDFIKNNQSLEKVCHKLTELYMIGKFMAYEIACDLRFTSLLENATDKLTWANMGPGAQRGLKRLGYQHKNQQEACNSMIEIYNDLTCLTKRMLSADVYEASVPFELREVEHSLCEFDKYMRVKLGEGRPRSKYNGLTNNQ